MKKVFLGLFIIFVLSSSPLAIGQALEGPKPINVTEDHIVNAYVSAPLVWQGDQSFDVKINFTLADFPTNDSSVEIITVQIFTIYPEGGGELRSTHSDQITLEKSNRSTTITKRINSPDASDRFHLNISLVARAFGGGSDQQSDTYSIRFPQDNTILVERDNLVPVINLYGFPPLSYFVNWLPIYGSLLFILAIPGIVKGVDYIREYRSSKKGSKQSEDKGDSSAGDTMEKDTEMEQEEEVINNE